MDGSAADVLYAKKANPHLENVSISVMTDICLLHDRRGPM